MNKIALIRKKYNPFGGGERIIEITLNALQKSGFEVYILTENWASETHSTKNKQIITLEPKYSFTRKGRQINFENAVHKAIQKHRFDLIQSNEMISGVDIIRTGDGLHRSWMKHRMKHSGFIQKILLKISPFHIYLMNKEKQVIEDKNLKGIICNSNMIKKEILSHFNVNESKIHVIYNAVDSEYFRPPTISERLQARNDLEIASKDKAAIFLGSGYFRKGLDYLLKALTLTPTSLKLIVVGYDKKINYYKQKANDYKLADRVIFVGATSNPRAYLWAADFMVLPTLYDPGPNSVLEGMACGLSVITTPQCGCAEILNSYENTILNADDYGQWAKVMTLHATQAEQSGLSLENRKIAENMSIQKMGGELAELFNDVGQV